MRPATWKAPGPEAMILPRSAWAERGSPPSSRAVSRPRGPGAPHGPAPQTEKGDSLTKDNLISVVLGILLGFIAGYLLHEVMAARQPPRFAGPTQGAAPQGMPLDPSPGTFQPPPDTPPRQQPPPAAPPRAAAPPAAPLGPPRGTCRPSPDPPPGPQPQMGAAGGDAAPMQEIQELRERAERNPNDAEAGPPAAASALR